MHPSNKSNVLLTELIIIVLFFSLIAVTITQVFVGAYHKSHLNASTQRAWIVATDWAERLSGEPHPIQMLITEGFAQQPEGDYALADEHNDYTVHIAFASDGTQDEGMVEATIRVLAMHQSPVAKGDALLATLPVASYISGQEVQP